MDAFLRPKILYADPDPWLSRRFREVFEDQYEVVSIEESGAVHEAAWVVISDERSEGSTGAPLLAEFRDRSPETVRILTSSSAEMSSVVHAINEFEVYRYVLKPWNPEELRDILRSAAERYERDRQKRLLLNEKLSALQRIVDGGRDFGALVLGEALTPWLRRSVPGAMAFLERCRASRQPAQPYWEGTLGDFGCEQAMTVLGQVHQVVSTLAPRSIAAHEGTVDAREVLRRAFCSAEPERKVSLRMEGEAGFFRTQGDMAEKMFAALFKPLLGMVQPGGSIAVKLTSDTAPDGRRGMHAHVRAEAEANLDLSQAPDLLAAFLLAYHHGGDIWVHRAPPEGPGFAVFLMRDPAEGPSQRSPALQELQGLLRRL